MPNFTPFSMYESLKQLNGLVAEGNDASCRADLILELLPTLETTTLQAQRSGVC